MGVIELRPLINEMPTEQEMYVRERQNRIIIIVIDNDQAKRLVSPSYQGRRQVEASRV